MLNTWSQEDLGEVVCTARYDLPLKVPSENTSSEIVSGPGDHVTAGISLLRDELRDELGLYWIDILTLSNSFHLASTIF